MTAFPWRTALFISLALNLIIVSVGVGAYVSGARLQRPAPATQAELPRAPGARAFMLALPQEARRVVRERLVQDAPAMREQRLASVQARLRVYEVARQEPYDAEAVKQAFAAMRASDAALAAHFHDQVADALAGLNAEDRRAALDAARAFASPGAVTRGGEDAAAPGAALGEQRALPDAAERRRERRERWRQRLRGEDSTP